MEPVRTHRAKTVVEAARLHRARERRERQLTIVEGPKLVSDVVSSGANVVQLFGEGGVAVDARALERLAGTKNPRGPVAVVEIPTDRLDPALDLLVSVGVSDPGNVGTMVRTAASFGWGYAYTEGSADPWSPKAIRAGAGGQFQTPVSKLATLGVLSEWDTVATVPEGGTSWPEPSGRRFALLIGEEASGLPGDVVAGASHRLTIHTPGPTESLNAAAAAAIAVYELSKGEREPGV